MSHTLAPIGISVYNRFDHFKKCIEHLQLNGLAKESELFIFSDFPSVDTDKKVIEDIRNYCKRITGFKKIHLIEREENFGGELNARNAFETLIYKYGKVIFLEDDILTAPGFLLYMNQALEYYKLNNKILSISAYSPPISKPARYRYDVFALKRYNGWGSAMWKDRYDKIQDVSIEEYQAIINNPKAVKKISENGEDILRMLKSEAYGEIDAFDVKAMYYQYINDMYTVYPVRSLTQNIGHDGTGVHCGVTNRFNVELWDKAEGFQFKKRIKPNTEIVKANRNFRDYKQINIKNKKSIVNNLKDTGRRLMGKTILGLLKEKISRLVR